MVVLGLVGPRDERAETPGAVLYVTDHPQVLDPLGVGLAGSHHECRSGLDAELMCGLHDRQPLLAGFLQGSDLVTRTADEDLRTGAGEGVEAGVMQPPDRDADRDTRRTADVHHLGATERMQSQLRVRRLDCGEGLLVPLDADVGAVAALQHDLRRAEIDRFTAAMQDLVQRAGPALWVLGRAVERAELA